MISPPVLDEESLLCSFIDLMNARSDAILSSIRRHRDRLEHALFVLESIETQSAHDGSLVKLRPSSVPAEGRNLPTSEPPRAEVVKAVPSTGCSSAHPDQPDDVRTPKDDLGKEGLQPTISRGPWSVSNFTRIMGIATELVDFTIGDIVKALPEMPYGSITGTITRLIADGRLYRIRGGVYSIKGPSRVDAAWVDKKVVNSDPVAAPSLTPKQHLSRAEVLAQIDQHVKTKGTMASPDFGDAEVNELWEKLRVRGHSLVKLPAKQHVGGRPFSLNHSLGITRKELLRRAKVIITTEKPIGKVVP